MEDETPTSLGVQTSTHLIHASACTNWHDCHFGTPCHTDREIHLLKCCKEGNPNHAFVCSPGTLEGQMLPLSCPRHWAGIRALGFGDVALSCLSAWCLPWPIPPSPAQMLSMEMKQSSFQGPSCFQYISLFARCAVGSMAASLYHLYCCNEGKAGVNTSSSHRPLYPTQITIAFQGTSLIKVAW